MPEQLEERVAYLEAEVERLKNKVESSESSQPWWEQIIGSFADNQAYDQAMQLGHDYRDSLRPSSVELDDQ
jgi:hypothetical protein